MPRFRSKEEYEAWKGQIRGQPSRPAVPPAPPGPRAPEAEAPTPSAPPPSPARGTPGPPGPARETAQTPLGEAASPAKSSFYEWTWSAHTDGPHRVALHLEPTGRETVTVDGVVVSDATSLKLQKQYFFEVGSGHAATLSVKMGLTGTVRCHLEVDGREVPVEGAPARTFGLGDFLPPIQTIPQARAAAAWGRGAAIIVASVTALIALLAGGGVKVTPIPINHWLALVDAGMYAALAWGIHRMLRTAALAALAIFVASRIYVLGALFRDGAPGGLGALIGSLLVVVSFVNGVRGTFAYRRLREGAPGWEFPDPRKLLLPGAGVLVLVVGLGFAWGRAQRQARLESECRSGRAASCPAAADGERDPKRATSLLQAGCTAQAHETCERLVGDDPAIGCLGDRAEICFMVADAYARGKKFDRAERLLTAMCDGGNTAACATWELARPDACRQGYHAACQALRTACDRGSAGACESVRKMAQEECVRGITSSCAALEEQDKADCEGGNSSACDAMTRRLEDRCGKGNASACQQHWDWLAGSCARGRQSDCARLASALQIACRQGYAAACERRSAFLDSSCALQGVGCMEVQEADRSECEKGILTSCNRFESRCRTDDRLPLCRSLVNALAQACARTPQACALLGRRCREGDKAACEAERSTYVNACQKGSQAACDGLAELCHRGDEEACRRAGIRRVITFPAKPRS